MSEELEQLHQRLFNQSMQLARVHTALATIAAAAELSAEHRATAQQALDACEADAGRIVADLRVVLDAAFSENQHGHKTWMSDHELAALDRLRAIAA